MSPTAAVTTITKQNVLETAHAALIAKLTAMIPPKAIRTFSGPSDFEAIASYFREAGEICDGWAEAVGFHVADNAPTDVDPRSFEDAISAGLDNAIYECDRAAERLIEDREAA